MTYSEKLKDPRWQKKRLTILKRDKFTCMYCGDKETELHIHHLKYSGEPWEAKNKDLITACKHCHIVISKKGFEFNKILKTTLDNNKGHKFVCKGVFSDGSEGILFIRLHEGNIDYVSYYENQINDLINFING